MSARISSSGQFSPPEASCQLSFGQESNNAMNIPEIPNKENVKAKAQVFLEALAQRVGEALGTKLRVVQQAVWWSPADPGDSQAIVQSKGSMNTLRSGGYEREVFNSVGVSMFYQVNLIDKGLAEQTELYNVLVAAGIQAQWIRFGFLLPLVAAWCKLPDPFDLTQPSAQGLLDEFTEAVTSGTSHTKYRDVIIPIDISGTPIELEEGVRIRTIEEEELWELGSDRTMITPPFSLQLAPSDNWCILEIELEHRHDDTQTGTRLYAIREAIVANLAIAAVSGFILLPLGMTTKFGSNATGTTTYGSRMPRQFGPFPGEVTVTIDPTARQQLQQMWPRVKEVMLSPSHYLSLPLRRLVDGLARMRFDDRIVDYAIGLEALLLKGDKEQGELSYRFRLRGAMVLAEAGEDRHQAFQDLKDFYNARSTIVHGDSMSKPNLRSLADNGEQMLRKIWKWHLDQGLTHQGAMARIDRRILGE